MNRRMNLSRIKRGLPPMSHVHFNAQGKACEDCKILTEHIKNITWLENFFFGAYQRCLKKLWAAWALAKKQKAN